MIVEQMLKNAPKPLLHIADVCAQHGQKHCRKVVRSLKLSRGCKSLVCGSNVSKH